MTRMKQLARRYCWWPSIDKDIEKTVSTCDNCQLHANSPTPEYTKWPEPTTPWSRIHIDYAGPFMNDMYLICVDAYSKFPYTLGMANTTSLSTIKALQQIFAIEGLPQTIVSDNGPQFKSDEFAKFCKVNSVEHITAAPFHPPSNGEAERFVRTFKTAMEKICSNGTTKDQALTTYLSTYRTTPNAKLNKSPAELLHGRQPRTLLAIMKPEDFGGEIRVAVNPSKYQINQKVYARNFNKREKWSKGIVIKGLGRRMYLIKSNYGLWRRHQNQLRKRDVAFENNGLPGNNEDLVPLQSIPAAVPEVRRSTRLKKPTVRFNC